VFVIKSKIRLGNFLYLAISSTLFEDVITGKGVVVQYRQDCPADKYMSEAERISGNRTTSETTNRTS
jgi:hypothetical protein